MGAQALAMRGGYSPCRPSILVQGGYSPDLQSTSTFAGGSGRDTFIFKGGDSVSGRARFKAGGVPGMNSSASRCSLHSPRFATEQLTPGKYSPLTGVGTPRTSASSYGDFSHVEAMGPVVRGTASPRFPPLALPLRTVKQQITAPRPNTYRPSSSTYGSGIGYNAHRRFP